MKKTLNITMGILILAKLAYSDTVPIKVIEGNVDSEIVLSGPVEAFEYQVIRAKFYSTVKKFAVEVGQKVKKGDLIAELEMDSLHKLEELQQTSLQYNEQKVKDAILDQKYNREVAAKQQLLSEQGIIPNKTAQEAYNKSSQQKLERMKAEKLLTDAKAELEETRNQIRIANYYAPNDGIVTQVLVNPQQVTGSISIATDTVLAQIDKPGVYLIKATAISSQVGRLKVGQKCAIYIGERMDATPGEVTSISLSTKGTKEKLSLFEVNIKFEWKGDMLNKGILGKVVFQEANKPTLIVPWNAVQLSTDGAKLRLLKPDAGWEEKSVVLGLRGKNRVQIKEGIKLGDIVEATLW